MTAKTWWLSFADDDGSRGVCVVDAPDILGATFKAHALGINPGGSVHGVEIPPDEPECAAEYAMERDRLFTPAELRAMGYLSIREQDDLEQQESN